MYFVIHWCSYGPASYVEMSGPETGGGVPLGEVSFAHLCDFVSFYLSFFIYDYHLYLINQVNSCCSEIKEIQKNLRSVISKDVDNNS